MSKLITLSLLSKFKTNMTTWVTSLLNGYVAKVDGKDLSANDLTDTLKSNYDAAYTHSTSAHAPSGAQANVIEAVTVNGTAVTPTNKTVNITVPTTVASMTDAADYAKKSDMGRVYQYAGSVETYDKLPTLGVLGENDPIPVYDCTDTGMNYGWTGTAWDNLGSIFSVETATEAEIDALFA